MNFLRIWASLIICPNKLRHFFSPLCTVWGCCSLLRNKFYPQLHPTDSFALSPLWYHLLALNAQLHKNVLSCASHGPRITKTLYDTNRKLSSAISLALLLRRLSWAESTVAIADVPVCSVNWMKLSADFDPALGLDAGDDSGQVDQSPEVKNFKIMSSKRGFWNRIRRRPKLFFQTSAIEIAPCQLPSQTTSCSTLAFNVSSGSKFTVSTNVSVLKFCSSVKKDLLNNRTERYKKSFCRLWLERFSTLSNNAIRV